MTSPVEFATKEADAAMMDTLIEALSASVGFVTKNHRRTRAQYRLIGSVPDERESEWFALVLRLLNLAAEREIPLDISKSYFVLEGEFRFGWRIIIKSRTEGEEALNDAVASVLSAVQECEVPKATHYELNARNNRNELVRGKGVQPSGSGTVVGRASAERAGLL